MYFVLSKYSNIYIKNTVFNYKTLECSKELFFVNVTLRAPTSKSCGTEKGGVAGLVAVGFSFMFCMRPRSQSLVAFLTTQTCGMPVFPKRSFALSWKITLISHKWFKQKYSYLYLQKKCVNCCNALLSLLCALVENKSTVCRNGPQFLRLWANTDWLIKEQKKRSKKPAYWRLREEKGQEKQPLIKEKLCLEENHNKGSF